MVRVGLEEGEAGGEEVVEEIAIRFEVGEHGLPPGLTAGVGGVEGFVAEGVDFCGEGEGGREGGRGSLVLFSCSAERENKQKKGQERKLTSNKAHGRLLESCP